jgi:hypothetical protein
MRSGVFYRTEHEATTNWRPEPFDAVSKGVVEVHACFEKVRGSADRLRATVEWSARVQRSLEALNARCLSQLERFEKESPPEASENLSAWLQDTLCLTPAAAESQLNTARKLEQLPTTAAAFGAGDLTAQQASVICQAVEQSRKTCLDPVAVEESLISAGKMLDTQQLLELWFQMRYEADQAAGLQAEQRRREQRRVYLRETWRGTFALEGWLDPEGGCTLKTALDALMKKRPRDDERTPGQRRADALTELARRALDSGDLPERGGEKPHLMLVAELSMLRLEPGSRLAELDWARWSAARPPAASLRPRCAGAPFTPPSRRCWWTPTARSCTWGAAHVRYRPPPGKPSTCVTEDASGPAARCRRHAALHITRRHSADGGSDELSNLRLYCTYHHGLLHPENECYRTGAGRQPNAP